jgi:hypothetical protein
VFTFLNDTVLVTYTHHRYTDVWPIYFGQLDELFPDIKSYVLSDVVAKDYIRHSFIAYEDKYPYWKQWCDSLNKIKCEYLIYMQEDFFLYNRPNLTKLEYYCKYLKNHPVFSFLRLIAHSGLPVQCIENDIFYLRSGNPYVFAMQPTIWKKDKFMELYREARSNDFREKKEYVDATIKLGINGLYVYNGEQKRGMFHFDSSVFPYIATGLVRRKWNTVEYPEELDMLTRKYHIDMALRGFYNPREPQEW